jgi:DNA-binding NarL/FixJ family response regulator
MSSPIRLLLADDQALMRHGLRGLLSLHADFEVVGETADGESTLASVAALLPDVLLLDVRMPGLSGLQVLSRLAEAEHRPAIIMLTTFEDDDALVQAAATGASAFFLKDVSVEILSDAIRRVAGGESLFGPAVDARARARLAALGVDQIGDLLPQRPTRRETEVLQLMARGFSNREIARALGTQTGTVKNHASSIFLKLAVRDRTQAVLRALSLGWL